MGEVLRALADAHPGTRSQLFADGGDLNRYVNVYLNDEDVRVLDGLETPVSGSDTVVILPAMAGAAQASPLSPHDLEARALRAHVAGAVRGLDLEAWVPRLSFGVR